MQLLPLHSIAHRCQHSLPVQPEPPESCVTQTPSLQNWLVRHSLLHAPATTSRSEGSAVHYVSTWAGNERRIFWRTANEIKQLPHVPQCKLDVLVSTQALMLAQ